MNDTDTKKLSKLTNPFHIEIKDDDLMRIDEAYPQLQTQEVMSEFNQQTGEYICKLLVSLDIDKDVLIKQTQEIQRLNNKIDKLYEQNKWHLCSEELPSDNRGVLCFDAYGDYFVGWYNTYWTVGEHIQINVIAWTELPVFKKEGLNE